MIPRLAEIPAPDALTLRFLEALGDSGFTGDLSDDDGARTVFATDNSVYQLTPQAVIFPRDVADIARVMRLLAEERFRAVKLAPRGGGTGTNGQSLTDGIVFDLSRHMNRILEINIAEGWARVEAGVVKDQLNAALLPHGMFFAPELSTSNRATVGGMISTDASGQGSCLYGKTRNHVLGLRVVLVDGTVWDTAPLESEALREAARDGGRVGTILRLLDTIGREHAAEIEAQFPKLNRCLTGYDLAHLRDKNGRLDPNAVLCGSEGTLGVLAEARLNILPIPKHVALVNLRYSSFDAALRDANALIGFGAASIETVDSKVLGLAQRDIVWDGVREYLPDDNGAPARGINLIEFVGDSAEAVEAAVARLTGTLDAAGFAGHRTGYTVAWGEAPVTRIWNMRKRAVGLLGNMPGDKRPIPFVEDTAVPPENLADYIAEFRALLDERGLDYGMFGHVDAGVLHVRPSIDMKDPKQELLIREVTDAVAALTHKYGGLLWGEHGKGIRSEFSPRFFGSLYPLLQAVKAGFDPHNQLNPGKIAAPDGAALLRVDGVPTRGQRDRTVPEPVRAAYDEAMHCNGNGACFNWDPDDAMCPSWKATRERRHSPKGRAMLVKEWLRRLAVAGTDTLAERGRPRLRDLPARIGNTLRLRRGEGDFNHAVKEAMDGCLACKSCVGGCPIKVNVPSFRSKFLELYHTRYLRPAKDHLVAQVERMAPALARMPGLYNALVGSGLGTAAMRWVGLVDSPKLSGIDLGAELRRRGLHFASPAALRALSDEERARSVVIVQDAFTGFYETGLVLDVLDLLLALGFRPAVAPFRANGKAQHVHGFLADFAETARSNATMLRELGATGVPLVGIDPSMTLTYRAEYVEALGREAVPEVLLLQEWLAKQAPAATAQAAGTYRLLPHCTERTNALASLRDWQSIYARHGLKLEILAAGCCGMAGTYGHEAEHRDTSAAIYALSWERHVASPDGLVATGYSCRSQVKRFGAVSLPHPATALLQALRVGVPAVAPEQREAA
ncbi:D-2-hydroxyglutarate dehydrogenase YdiJ [Roseomonas elaeocarpi]|uniref:FAD-binding and (Fe-S)-binding domain-containing protein n=1 Tax=Roseomonas elaeocarpi TaxID=907779 RepID=A0ABV6JST3_9PROT